MKKTILHITLIITALTACTQTVPDGIIPQNKMKKILEEVQLTDAMLIHNNTRYGDSTSMKYYAGIYQKFNVTKEDFSKSMKYYSLHPKELKKIYTAVEKSLALRDSIIKEKMSMKIDTTQLWAKPDSCTVEKFTTEGVAVNIPVQFQKTYYINADIKIYADSHETKVTPYFVLVAKDTSYVVPALEIVSDTAFHHLALEQMILDSTITHLEGNFLGNIPDSVEVFRHFEIKNIQIYTTGAAELPPLKESELQRIMPQ